MRLSFEKLGVEITAKTVEPRDRRLAIAQAFTDDYFCDLSWSIQEFACFFDASYVRFSVTGPFNGIFTARYGAARVVFELFESLGASVSRVLFIDADILWTGPRYTNLRRIQDLFCYGPYDLLLSHGFQCPGHPDAFYHSFCSTGFILASRAGAEALYQLMPEIHDKIPVPGTVLLDQAAFARTISSMPSSISVTIDDLAEVHIDYRRWNGQPFVHFCGTATPKKQVADKWVELLWTKGL